MSSYIECYKEIARCLVGLRTAFQGIMCMSESGIYTCFSLVVGVWHISDIVSVVLVLLSIVLALS